MKKLLSVLVLTVLACLNASPSFSISCSYNGSMEYDNNRLGLESCVGSELRRIGSYVSTDACSNEAEVEWKNTGSYLVYCNGSYEVPLKCGSALGACNVPGEQRYDSATSSMQMCDGTNWYSMSTSACISDMGEISWVAAGKKDSLLISDDGQRWLAVDLPVSLGDIYDVDYGDGVWVAVGGGPTILSSVDGKVWSQVAIGGLGVNTVSFTSVEYADGMWMVSQGYGGNTTATSPDGIVWTAVTNYNNGYASGLLKTKGFWVAGGDSGTIKYSSNDGSAWSSYSFGASGDPQALGYANGYLLVKKSTGSFAISEDQIGVSHEVIANNLSSSIQWVGDRFMSGSAGNGFVVDTTSTILSDLKLPWRQYDVGDIAFDAATRFGFGNGEYVFGSSNGQLGYSSDLNTFSSLVVPISGEIREIAYGGAHNDPGSFSFTDVTGASLSTVIESDSVTISSSMTVPQKVYAGNGAEIQINGGSWVAGDGSATVTAGDTLKVRVTSAFGSLEQKITSLQVGPHTTHWGITNREYQVSWMLTSGSNAHIIVSDNPDATDYIESDDRLTEIFGNVALSDIEYGDGKWVVSNAQKLAYSEDGFNWTGVDVSDTVSSYINKIYYWSAKDLWVMKAHNQMLYSNDLENWTAAAGTGANGEIDGYLATDGETLIVGDNVNSGDAPMSLTTDGLTWSNVSSELEAASVAYADGYWFATEGQTLYISQDAFATSSTYNDLSGVLTATSSPIVYGGGYFMLTNEDTGNIDIANKDGVLSNTWLGVTKSNTISGASFGNGYWVGVRSSGIMFYGLHSDMVSGSGSMSTYTAHSAGIDKPTYGGIQNDPGAFAFTAVSDTELASLIESNVITIATSMTSTQKVYAGNGAEVQINGGAWVAGDGTSTVTGGDTLKVRLTSANQSLTTKVSTVQVGTHATHFKVTTKEFVVNWIQGLDDAKVMLATDGSTVIEVDVSDLVVDASVSILNVEYGNGLWVAVGSSGTILKSENGFDWEAVAAPAALSGYDISSIKYSADSNVWYIAGRQIGGNPNHMVAFNGDLTVSEDLGAVSSYGHINTVVVDGKVYVFTNYGYFEGTDNSTLSAINLTSTTSVPGDIDFVSFANGYWYGTAADQANLYYRGEGLKPFEADWTSYTLDDHGGYKYQILTGGGKVIMGYQNNNRVTYFDDVSTTQNVRVSSALVKNGEFANGNWFISGYQGQYAYWDNNLTSIASVNASEHTNSVTYGGTYNDPGAFTFTAVSETELSTLTESEAITIDASMTSTQKVYAGNGAEVQVNGGSWVAGNGAASVTAGDTLKVRMASANDFLTAKTTTVQVGTRITHWTVTTRQIIASWAAGGSDQFALSEDGVLWKSFPLPLSMTAISSIEYGDGKWVVGGADSNDKGVLAYSSNAIDWNSSDLSSFFDGKVAGISYGVGNWLARVNSTSGGGGGQTVISSDGENWSLATTPPSTYSGSYEYARGVWINSGYNIYKSTDNGDNWVKVVDAAPTGGVVHGNGRWLVISNVDSTENYFASDDNGDTWTQFDPTVSDSGVGLYSKTFAKDNFYYTDQGGKIWYGNEISSTYTSISVPAITYGLTFADDKWLMSRYQAGIYYSSDDDLSTATRVLINGVSMGNIKFGGVHNDPGDFEFTDVTDVSLSAYIESDTVTISSSMTTPQKVYAWNGAEIQVNGGSWVAGDGTTSVSAGDTLKVRMESPLASLREKTSTIQVGSHTTHWTLKTEEFNVTWAFPAKNGSENYIAVSKDNPTSGSDFLKVDMTPFYGTNMVSQISYGKGIWLATKSGGPLIYSTDGLEWKQHPTPPSNQSLDRLRYWEDKQIFVWDTASGSSNFYSTDGMTWVAASGRTTSSDGLFFSKDYAFAGNSSSAVVQRSADGATWSDIPLGFTGTGAGPAYGDGLLLFAGSGGSIYYSEDEGNTATSVSMTIEDGTIAQTFYGGGTFVRVRNNFAGRGVSHATAEEVKRDNWRKMNAAYGGWTGDMEFGNGLWLHYGYSGQIGRYEHEKLLNNQTGTTIYNVGGTGWPEYGGLANDPGYFSLIDVTNTVPNTLIESESITVGPISNTLYVYAGHGAEVQVNGGSWMAGTGSATVVSGDTFKVRMNASNYGALRKKVSTVQVGTQVSNWQITNMDFDNKPDAMDFTDAVDVSPSIMYESDILQVTGVDYAVAVSVSLGGEFRTCSDASCSSVVLDWSNYNGYVDPNGYVQLRIMPSSVGETSSTTALQVGTLLMDWMVTTYDNTPAALNDFTDVTDVSISTLVESDIIQINDIYNGISITVAGDEGYAVRTCTDASCTSVINDWGNSEITISNGNYVQVRTNSANGGPAVTEVSITFGGGAIDWIVTTEKYDLTPFGFNPSVWYDAKDVDGDFVEEGMSESGLNGSGLITWVDKGLYNIDVTQTTASLQPIYDGNKVYFDGNDDYLRRSYHRRFETVTETSIFIVADVAPGGTSYKNIINMRSTYGGYNVQATDTDWDLRVVDTGGTQQTVDGPAYTHYKKDYIAATMNEWWQGFYVNKSQVNTSTYNHLPADTTAQLCVGAAGNVTCDSNTYSGNIYEILVFDKSLAGDYAASRTIVFNYLLDKWEDLEIADVETDSTNTLIYSDVITYRGLGTQTVNVTNGAEVQVNGGSWVGTGVATITSGDSLRLRMTSASTAPTAVTTNVTIGPKSTTWNVKTLDATVFAPMLWLDAKDVDGDFVDDGIVAPYAVSSWVDKSSFGFDATQTVVAAQPTSDGFAMTFDGSADYLEVPYDERLQSAEAYTFFIVTEVNGNDDVYRTPLGMRYSNSSPTVRTGFNVFAGSNNQWQFWTGEANTWDQDDSGEAVVNDIVEIYHGAMNNVNNKRMYHNNIQVTSGGKLLKNHLPTSLCIGSINAVETCSTTNLMYNGKIYEVLVYDSILSDASMTTVYNYLDTKWRDNTPDTVDFTDATGVTPATTVESDIIQITGISNAVGVNVNGANAEYRICSDASCTTEVQTWTSTAGAVTNGQYVQMRSLSAGPDSFSDVISTLAPQNWYKFNETSGTTLYDYGSVGVNGTYASGSYTLGDAGLTATGDLAVGLTSSYEVNAPSSATAWLRGASNYSSVTLFNSALRDGPAALYSLRVDSTTDQQISAFIHTGDHMFIDDNTDREDTGIVVTEGKDYALFVTKNGTAMTADLYDLATQTSQTYSWTAFNTTIVNRVNTLTFGELNEGYGYHLDGVLDDVVFFNSTLTPTNISDIKSAIHLAGSADSVTAELTVGSLTIDWTNTTP